MTKGRRTEEEETSKRWFVVKELIGKGVIHIDELAEKISSKYEITSKSAKVGIIKRYIPDIQHRGIPIKNAGEYVSIALSDINFSTWKKTPTGNRLLLNNCWKRSIAQKAITFIQANQTDCSKILFGSGTASYECLKHLLINLKKTSVTNIYTNNLLTLPDFVYHNPDPEEVKIEFAPGKLDINTASLSGPGCLDFLDSLEIDCVVTGFKGLSDHFYTGHGIDEKEKEMYPPESSKYVLILLEWSKISHKGPNVVELTKEQTDKSAPQYVIVTDPEEGINKEKEYNALREKILKYWKDRGLKILTENISAKP